MAIKYPQFDEKISLPEGLKTSLEKIEDDMSNKEAIDNVLDLLSKFEEEENDS